jgi:hypothetical protein
MIVIDRTIVSDDLLDKQFVCSLQQCKGNCCVAGESGAPLTANETVTIEKELPGIMPLLTEEGKKAIQQFGAWQVDMDGDLVTPLVEGQKQCAYVIFRQGIAACAWEKAFELGISKFQKPVSCHLYPVRITEHKNYDAVNYESWSVCSPACKNGKELGVPVFRFVKNALIRKYGQEWYAQLEGAAQFRELNPAESRA